MGDGSRSLRCGQLGHCRFLSTGDGGVRDLTSGGAASTGPFSGAGAGEPPCGNKPTGPAKRHPSRTSPRAHQSSGPCLGRPLPHRHLGERLLIILQHGSTPGQQPGALQGQGHVRQLELQQPSPQRQSVAALSPRGGGERRANAGAREERPRCPPSSIRARLPLLPGCSGAW